MSTPASSPARTPSSSASSPATELSSPCQVQNILQPRQAQCTCKLSQIITQLKNENPEVRFQCLAFFRTGQSVIQTRCSQNCESQPKTNLFETAKQILQQDHPITSAEYTSYVIRSLFCKTQTHSAPAAFTKYRDLLAKHWEGKGTPIELDLWRQCGMYSNCRPVLDLLAIYPWPTRRMKHRKRQLTEFSFNFILGEGQVYLPTLGKASRCY